MTAVEFVRVLGPIQFVTGSGEAVDLPSPTQRRLLAALALASGTTLPPERLGAQLDLSAGALRTAVSRLRGRLGPDAIRTDAFGYRLIWPVDTTMFLDLLLADADDPHRLDAVDAALALWHGPALGEFSHEPWAEAEAARLEELRGVAIEDRADLLIARGRGGEAIASLEAHIAANPLRDRCRGQLIQALAGEGRQADALRAYQDYRAYLAEETGTEPSAHVQSLERRVASDWIDGPAQAERPAGRSTTSRAAAPTIAIDIPLHGILAHTAELIGREPARQTLDAELLLAKAGSLRLLLVDGEAGIGKTTLLAAFARGQHRNGQHAIVYGRCEEGAAVPLQPFRSIVGTLVEHAPIDVLRSHCERCGGELLRIAPNLANRIWAPPPMSGDDATERYHLFEAIADLMRRLADHGPLIVLLDDLQWIEPTALVLLRHLAGALIGEAVLVVASFRDAGEQRATEVRAAMADLERLTARRLSLVGLDDAELADLITSVVARAGEPSTEVLSHVRVQTAGNPLYASQLVRHLSESGHIEAGDDGTNFTGDFESAEVPPSLVAVVGQRVRALGDTTAEILQAGSVLGVEFGEDTLVGMAHTGASEVATALDAAIGAGLLAEVDGSAGSLRFTHALVARSLYTELHGPLRRELHRRAARVLEATSAELSQPTVIDLARHCAVAGDRAAAQRWSTLAGAHAFAHLAPAEAATWYRTALDHAVAANRPEHERAELIERMGEALHRVGDPDAHATLQQAASLARACGAHDVLVRAALADDRGFMRVGMVDEARLSTVEAALAVVDPCDTTAHARLLALHARELVHTERSDQRIQSANRAIELLDQSDDPSLLPQMVTGLIFALCGPGRLSVRRDLASRAVAAAELVDDPFLQFWANRAENMTAIESAELAAADAALGRMRAIADEVGEPRLRWVTLVADAFDAMMKARLSEAEDLANAALEIGLRIAEPEAFLIWASQLFVIYSFAGRYAELHPVVEQTMRSNPQVLTTRLAYALTCLVVGRVDEGRAILAEGRASGFAHIASDYLYVSNVLGYAVLAIEAEDVEAAALLYPIIEPFRDEVAFTGLSSQGPIVAYLGKLASLLGWHDVADEHLHRALAVVTDLGWTYHRATTLIALALSQQRRTGELDARSDAWLTEAEAIATDHGLQHALVQVNRLRN